MSTLRSRAIGQLPSLPRRSASFASFDRRNARRGGVALALVRALFTSSDSSLKVSSDTALDPHFE
jgi:hypothetical protein